MENVNYTKFSEEKKDETPVVGETTATEGPVITVDAEPPTGEATSGYVEVVDEPEPPKEVSGVVNCLRLNVRAEASKNAAVLKIIEQNSKVKIDEENSTDDFYKVQIAGITGFCMKDFITVE